MTLSTPLKLRNAVNDTVSDLFDIYEHKAAKDFKKNHDMMMDAIYTIQKTRLETLAFIQSKIDLLNLDLKTLKSS